MNIVLVETRLPSGVLLQLVKGDITTESTDAIVNAANEYLYHGGGLAETILRRGGERIQRDSEAWLQKHGLVTHESPAVTSGGRLPCRYVIHAVGPVWGETEDAEAKLATAITASLRRADELGLNSLALPAISTGIFGFPKDRAAVIILAAIRDYFDTRVSHLKLIRMVLFDEDTLWAFRSAWNMFRE
ncbi:MAG: macro domain-containing protein [Anaerolineales bacterium]|nr:macro domain-containing protein [Anaerolineales bacterium]MCX7608896.1 macro domain-containing protein [Anaerolineales bacterium]MDW8227460.1 macro domain-containing protein [Anaerolineales bacterium]